MTIACELPDFTDKSTYENEAFDWKYPNELTSIFLEDLGMDVEEALRGIYLDVTHETDPDLKIDRTFILATGYGRKAKIFD